MKRRTFLMGLGGAAALPVVPAPAVQAAGYNRYMYGLAVFQARKSATVNATTLMSKLKVSALQAEAMIGEMAADGYLAQASTMAKQIEVMKPHYDVSENLKDKAKDLAEWFFEDDEEDEEPRDGEV